MNIAELITECGVDKVDVQYIDQCADTLNMNGGTTRITFGTEQPLTPHGTDKLGIVVWLDRDDVKAALAKAMSARQSQDPKGLGPKDASAVGNADLPKTQGLSTPLPSGSIER